MKKYEKEFIKFKELFKCYVFLYYDILRLTGYMHYREFTETHFDIENILMLEGI